MEQRSANSQVRGSPGYAVCLLEDDASLWPEVHALLPGGAVERADCDASAIGLLGWTSASKDETARLPALRAQHPGPLVAVVREMPSALGARMIAARLEGMVLAGEIEHTLLPTLAAVAAGQCVVPRAIRQIVDRPPLSPRERQILAMIVLDFSNAEIATKLFVSESNVKNHLSSAFQKLGVKSRSAAAELILDRESGLGPGILRISPEESLPGAG
jgi:DNA-binding NarL/FixJ family response regulator